MSDSPEALAVDDAKRKLREAVDLLGVNYTRWYIEQYAKEKE